MLGRLQDFAMRRLDKSLVTGRILLYLVGTVTILAVAFAAIMRVVDHEDYPNFGRALWWSVQTVTTVGYGDVTPTQPFGRLVAAALMIIGFASLSLLSGIIASALIARRRVAEADPDLVRVERRLDELERLIRGR
jgi:voltage-gated potassium channel